MITKKRKTGHNIGPLLPFGVYLASDDTRTGSACTVLQHQLDYNVYICNETIQCQYPINTFRREECILKEIRNEHIIEVYTSSYHRYLQSTKYYPKAMDGSRNLENQ